MENQKESWYERNKETSDFWITIGTLIMTGGAFLISILVMLHQDNIANKTLAEGKENIAVQKRQLEFVIKQAAEADEAMKKVQQRDSIKFNTEKSYYQGQIQALKQQAVMQDYMKNIQLEIDQPNIIFDSLSCDEDTVLLCYFRNTGRRSLQVTNIVVVMEAKSNLTRKDTIIVDTAFPFSEKIISNQSLIFTISYSDSRLHNTWVLSGDYGIIFFIKIEYKDLFENRKEIYKSQIFLRDFPLPFSRVQAFSLNNAVFEEAIKEGYRDVFKTELDY